MLNTADINVKLKGQHTLPVENPFKMHGLADYGYLLY